MSFETDLLIDRRRLKRRLTIWRIAAVLAAAAAVLLVLGRAGIRPAGTHLARLNVAGIITDDRKLVEAVDRIAGNSAIPALIVSIDSPGGSVAGGESLHAAIARVARVKPVVAVMRGTAASAGYMVSLPAARIFARESTLTGSVGVLLQTGEASGLLAKLGIGTEAYVSGPLKDQPSFTRPTSPAGREVLQSLVMDMYDQFVGMVADGRHMAKDRVLALADGRAYTGRQALGLGLVDAIGDERDARAWLEREKHVSARLPVRDVRPEAGWGAELTGSFLGPILSGLVNTVVSQRVTLDGAWALWQPALTGD